MVIDYDKVKDFWGWFKSVSSELLMDPTNAILISKLDDYIYSLGDSYDWEMGPIEWDTGDEKQLESYLCISPCLDESLLTYTKEIISFAPACEGWLFLYAKPAKGWIPNWKMLNEVGQSISIDTSSWEYTLYQFEDYTYDIDVWISKVEGNTNTRYSAVKIALTNLLGEERFMRMIKNVTIVEDENDKIEKQWSSLKHLEKHLRKLDSSN